MKPGIHEGIEFDKYLDIDALSFSDLENWLRGKPHSLGRRGTLGSLAHCLVLEGAEAVKARYVKLQSDADLRSKANREAKEALELATGKTAVKPSEWAQVCEMYRGIQRCERAVKALAVASKREVAVIADMDGTLTKARVDLLGEKFLLDVKTTHCANSDFFRDSVVDFNYAARAAFYIDNVAAVLGRFLPFRWLCVSTAPPFDAWIDEATNEQVAFGRKYYQAILKLYARYGKGVEDGN